MGYYIRSLKNKKTSPKWKVQYISYKKRDQKKTSKAKVPKRAWDIPKDRWRYLGFHASMNIEEAKIRANQLNTQVHLKLQEERLKKIREKENSLHLRYQAMLPPEFVEEFEVLFIYKKGHLSEKARKQKSRRKETAWKAAKRMITILQIEPSKWVYHDHDFYEYLGKNNTALAISTASSPWPTFGGTLFQESLPIPFSQ